MPQSAVPADGSAGSRTFGAGLSNFFLRKNDTLLHSLVDATLKAVLNGVLIAVVAALVLDQVESYQKLAEQRAALRQLRNDTLTTTIATASKSWAEIPCAHDPSSLLTEDCRRGLDETIVFLRARKAMLEALFTDEDFGTVDDVIGTAVAMRQIDSPTEIATAGKPLSDRFSIEITLMVDALAQHIQ